MRFWLAALFFLVFCIGARADVVIDDSKSYPDSYTTPRGEKGAVTIKCTGVKVVVDTSLPSEGGAAGTDVILLNPNMLNKQPKAVRLFVFAHECGHTQPEIDDSELLADKYAVKRGVEEGWLDEAGLKQVCESFDDAPATRRTPSGLPNTASMLTNSRMKPSALFRSRNCRPQRTTPMIRRPSSSGTPRGGGAGSTASIRSTKHLPSTQNTEGTYEHRT
jgi:hypothetical protein